MLRLPDTGRPLRTGTFLKNSFSHAAGAASGCPVSRAPGLGFSPGPLAHGGRLLYRRMFRGGLMSSMNSIRVDCRVRKTPSMAEVTALEFCFSTPRIIMQR